MQPPMPSDRVAPRHDAITAVPGIRLGHWTNRRWATGCTAIICEQGAVPGYFGPGGAPGTLDTDLIRAENSITQVHGVLLTGGSLFGLEAASGIKRYLVERGVGIRLAPGLPSIPIVVGAVVFDLPIGRPNHPDRDSGYRAARGARAGGVEQGSVGVGAGCTVGKAGPRGQSTKGGFGTAAAHHDSGLIVGAAVATNSVGDVVNPADGSLVAGVRVGEQGEMTRGAAILRDKPFATYLAELRGGRGRDGRREHHPRRGGYQRAPAQGARRGASRSWPRPASPARSTPSSRPPTATPSSPSPPARSKSPPCPRCSPSSE